MEETGEEAGAGTGMEPHTQLAGFTASLAIHACNRYGKDDSVCLVPLLHPRGGISRYQRSNIAAAVGFDATDQPPALRQGEGWSSSRPAAAGGGQAAISAQECDAAATPMQGNSTRARQQRQRTGERGYPLHLADPSTCSQLPSRPHLDLAALLPDALDERLEDQLAHCTLTHTGTHRPALLVACRRSARHDAKTAATVAIKSAALLAAQPNRLATASD